MLKNYKKAVLLLMTLPFLMASYNGPHFYIYDYSSYDLTYVSHEEIDNEYVYTLNVKHDSRSNYLYSMELKGTIDEESYFIYQNSITFSDVFSGYIIGPNAEKTIKVVSKKEISDISELSKRGTAINIDHESIYKSYADGSVVESIELESEHPDNPNGLYVYNVNYKEEAHANNYCTGLLELTYDEETFYLLIDNYSSGSSFYTYQQIDLTKLKVNNITFIESYRVRINEGGMMMVLLIFLGIVILIHGALFGVIFLIIYLTRRAKRRKLEKATTDK